MDIRQEQRDSITNLWSLQAFITAHLSSKLTGEATNPAPQAVIQVEFVEFAAKSKRAFTTCLGQ